MPSTTKVASHPILGHICATASAALAFVVIGLFNGVMFGGALSTVHSLSDRISQMIVMAILLFMVLSVFTFFTAMIPVLVVHKIAQKFSIRSFWYYVACGALTGLVLSPVAVFIMPSWYTDPPELPPLLERALNFARFSVPSGAVGGFAYWIVTGRLIAGAQIANRNH